MIPGVRVQDIAQNLFARWTTNQQPTTLVSRPDGPETGNSVPPVVKIVKSATTPTVVLGIQQELLGVGACLRQLQRIGLKVVNSSRCRAVNRKRFSKSINRAAEPKPFGCVDNRTERNSRGQVFECQSIQDWILVGKCRR